MGGEGKKRKIFSLTPIGNFKRAYGSVIEAGNAVKSVTTAAASAASQQSIVPSEIRKLDDPSKRFEAMYEAFGWTEREINTQIVALRRTKLVGMLMGVFSFVVVLLADVFYSWLGEHFLGSYRLLPHHLVFCSGIQVCLVGDANKNAFLHRRKGFLVSSRFLDTTHRVIADGKAHAAREERNDAGGRADVQPGVPCFVCLDLVHWFDKNRLLYGWHAEGCGLSLDRHRSECLGRNQQGLRFL